MKATPYTTYETAACDYLVKLHALMQSLQGSESSEAKGAFELPIADFIRHTEEIAGISSSMILLAREHLVSSDLLIREGIRGHFIDQAAVELLLGIELLQIGSQEAGAPSTAAARATYNAALREAISAADKSSSAPASQGIPVGESRRTADFTTVEEAVSALKLSAVGAAGSILRWVQELGRDIAFELAMGTQCAEAIQGAPQTPGQIAELLIPIKAITPTPVVSATTVAGGILGNVYEKISALLDKDAEDSVRTAIGAWLIEIRHAGNIELFDEKAAGFLGIAELKKAAETRAKQDTDSIESITKAADLLKSHSDKFMVLADRMRKLEDAIRLGRIIQMPRVPAILAALQITLLAALAFTGREFICNKIGKSRSQEPGARSQNKS